MVPEWWACSSGKELDQPVQYQLSNSTGVAAKGDVHAGWQGKAPQSPEKGPQGGGAAGTDALQLQGIIASLNSCF